MLLCFRVPAAGEYRLYDDCSELQRAAAGAAARAVAECRCSAHTTRDTGIQRRATASSLALLHFWPLIEENLCRCTARNRPRSTGTMRRRCVWAGATRLAQPNLNSKRGSTRAIRGNHAGRLGGQECRHGLHYNEPTMCPLGMHCNGETVGLAQAQRLMLFQLCAETAPHEKQRDGRDNAQGHRQLHQACNESRSRWFSTVQHNSVCIFKPRVHLFGRCHGRAQITACGSGAHLVCTPP